MFLDPRGFPFVATLEAAHAVLLAEYCAWGSSSLPECPDALTRARAGYDERGWRYLSLVGEVHAQAARARWPRTLRLLEGVPGLVNAGISVLESGTHLEPHRGELEGVLRCHLALCVPEGDAGIRGGGELRRWQAGRCLVFDDRVEHEAWNRGNGDRAVLLITFRGRP